MKKSFLKKVLAAAMAVLMISSCVPLAAVAADEEVNYSSAIAAYKQKMSEAAASKTVYKNMAESYTYYMAAVKYNDGYDTSDANKALADKLTPATETTFAESNKYTGPETLSDLISEWKLGSDTIPTSYYNDMLSQPDLTVYLDGGNTHSAATGFTTRSFVWLYDGDDNNKPTAPINAKAIHTGSGLFAASAIYLICLFKNPGTDGGDFTLGDGSDTAYWHFANGGSANNFYTSTQYGDVYSIDKSDISHSISMPKNNTNKWYYGSNYMVYTGDSSSFGDNYYVTSNKEFGSRTYYSSAQAQNKVTCQQIYIINYAAVKNALADAMGSLTNIGNYTESSVSSFLGYIDALTSQKYTFGLQNGDNGALSTDSDTSTANTANKTLVENLANKLKTGVDNLAKAKLGLADRADIAAYLAAFKNAKANFANGNSVDSQNWTYSSWNAFVADYNKYSVIDPYNTVKSSETETVTMPQAISAYKALSPVANYEAYNAIVEAVKQQDMNAFTESYIKSNSSVYGLIGQYGTNASSITFNNGVANGVTETTSTDGTASTAYVNVNGTVWKNATQTELDHYVGAVKSALTEALGDTTGAKRNSYTVTVTEYTNDVAGTPVKTTKYFGDNFSVAGLDSTVAKIVVNGKEFPATDSFTVRIQSNTDIKVYKTDNASLADKKAVQVQDIYGKSAQAYYLDSNATVVFNGNQFTSGSASYQAQEIGSYAFVKWQVNGKDVAPGATMSVSEIKTIKPVYKVSTEKTYNVTLDETAVEVVNTKNIYYDSKVVVKPQDGAVAIAAKIGNAYYVVNYGAGEYTFYGCGDVNLYSVMPSGNGYTVHGESLDAATAEKVKEQKPFVWSVKDDNGTKLTTYSTFSNGTKIIEAGTMYYVSETAPSEESFKLGNEGVRSVAAKNPNAESSQYWLGITYGSKKLYTRAYVKYEATVNGTTVQVIDYGNIVSNAK